jgi:methyl-CpG-binding domain protein 4
MRDDLMVQEQIKGSWQHMVGVIMLNQTDRIQVKRVLPVFLKKWPNPKKFLKANIDDVIETIRSLGMYNRRAKMLVQMSKDYLTWDGDDATMLYGIGKYGSDSYEIFFKNNYSVQPTDKELKRYLKERGINVFETA